MNHVKKNNNNKNKKNKKKINLSKSIKKKTTALSSVPILKRFSKIKQ
jgi:hypothetical protein